MKTRIVYPQLWLDKDFAEKCGKEAKLLFCYLINNMSLGLTRYLHLNDRQISFDTGLTANELATAKKELSSIGWCYFYEDWVYHNHKCAYMDFEGRDRVLQAKKQEVSNVPDHIKEYFKGLLRGYEPVLIQNQIQNQNHKYIRNNTELERLEKHKDGIMIALGKVVILLFLSLFVWINPASAETIIVRYQIRSTSVIRGRHDAGSAKMSSGHKLASPTPTPFPVKEKTTAGRAPTITPIPKYLTDKGAKTREIVLTHLSQYYSGEDLTAADNILKKEAGYRYDAVNEIGACGIVQALPCEKLGCSLDESGIICQAQWFIGYINRRYGSPKIAWQHHLDKNWY